ncbi:hypothetical protein [Methylocystis iwaonis]|uniref:hypothetical protein n=1 Tax=Methylocystis iwaonis TaxID=2885079 RepID=UPI002E7B3E47|nr:hypothetical protein [Methylocystis iwaonis]
MSQPSCEPISCVAEGEHRGDHEQKRIYRAGPVRYRGVRENPRIRFAVRYPLADNVHLPLQSWLQLARCGRLRQGFADTLIREFVAPTGVVNRLCLVLQEISSQAVRLYCLRPYDIQLGRYPGQFELQRISLRFHRAGDEEISHPVDKTSRLDWIWRRKVYRNDIRVTLLRNFHALLEILWPGPAAGWLFRQCA